MSAPRRRRWSRSTSRRRRSSATSAPSLASLADRLEGKLPNASALLGLREGILAHLAERSTEDRFPLTPQRIVHDVRQVIPPDGIVALDNGMYKIWFARNYRTSVANTLLLDNALATMGAGLPSAIAAALIHPERRVLAVCGDGGFMMNSQELETAVRLKLNLVVLVLEDHAYGMIRWKQEVDAFPDFGLEFGNPDFVAYAKSYGAKGSRVGKASELLDDAGSCFQRRRRASRRRARRLQREHARARQRVTPGTSGQMKSPVTVSGGPRRPRDTGRRSGLPDCAMIHPSTCHCAAAFARLAGRATGYWLGAGRQRELRP